MVSPAPKLDLTKVISERCEPSNQDDPRNRPQNKVLGIAKSQAYGTKTATTRYNRYNMFNLESKIDRISSGCLISKKKRYAKPKPADTFREAVLNKCPLQ